MAVSRWWAGLCPEATGGALGEGRGRRGIGTGPAPGRGVPDMRGSGACGGSEVRSALRAGARLPSEGAGDEGKGWEVAMATAGFERGLMLRSPARFQDTARKLVELYKKTAAAGTAIAPGLSETVAQCWMDAEAYALNTYQTVSKLLAGGKIGAEASLNKIFWSELDVKMHQTALKLLGHRAELLPEAPAAGDVGEWLDGYIFALAGPIYAGTNEIQRNIIAERILGMPRK